MENRDKCKRIRVLADDYLDGELTLDESAEFERHISECEECRRDVSERRALRAALAESAEEVPDRLHAKIISNIPVRTKKRGRVARRATICAICAVMMLACLYSFVILSLGGANSEAPLPGGSQDAVSSSIENSISKQDTMKEESVGNAVIPEITDSSPDDEPEALPDSTVAPPTEEAPPLDDATVIPEKTQAETFGTSAPTQNNSPSDVEAEASPGSGRLDYAETNKAPGGDEITLALLIVSGLLAVASFVAFLISLSSVRNYSAEKKSNDTENKE